MAVYSCTGPAGEPGYQWSEPGQQVATECHIYDPADPKARAAAVRLATRDGAEAGGQGDAPARTPLTS